MELALESDYSLEVGSGIGCNSRTGAGPDCLKLHFPRRKNCFSEA